MKEAYAPLRNLSEACESLKNSRISTHAKKNL